MKREKGNSILKFAKRQIITSIIIVLFIFLIGIVGLLFGSFIEEDEYREDERKQIHKNFLGESKYKEILEESGYTEIEPVADIFIVFNLMEYYKPIQTQEEKIEEKKYINTKSVRLALSMNSSGVEYETYYVQQRFGVLHLFYISTSPFSLHYPATFATMAKVAIEDPFIKSLVIRIGFLEDTHNIKLTTLLGEEDLQNLRQEYNSATTEIQREKILAKYESMTLKNGIFMDGSIPTYKGNPDTEIHTIANNDLYINSVYRVPIKM